MSSQLTKNRASGGATQCGNFATLLPTRLTPTFAMFISFGNVTIFMVEKLNVKCNRGHVLGKVFLYQDRGINRGHVSIDSDSITCNVCKRIALRKLARIRSRWP